LDIKPRNQDENSIVSTSEKNNKSGGLA